MSAVIVAAVDLSTVSNISRDSNMLMQENEKIQMTLKQLKKDEAIKEKELSVLTTKVNSKKPATVAEGSTHTQTAVEVQQVYAVAKPKAKLIKKSTTSPKEVKKLKIKLVNPPKKIVKAAKIVKEKKAGLKKHESETQREAVVMDEARVAIFRGRLADKAAFKKLTGILNAIITQGKSHRALLKRKG